MIFYSNMIISASFAFYFTCLCLFSFVSHPIVYCFLLLGCSLRGALICYSFLGFS